MVAQIQGIDLDYKPWGGLAGVMSGYRTMDMEKANELALQQSALDNIVKQKEAAFAQDEMNNPTLRDARLQGMIGENQTKQAAGMTAMGSQDSDMKAKIAENLARVPVAKLKEMHTNTEIQTQGLMALQNSLAQNRGIPDMNFVSKIGEIAPSLGMSSDDVSKLLANPSLLNSTIERNKQILTTTAEHLSKVDTEIQKNISHGQYITGPQNASHERVAAGNNAATIAAARIAADSRLAVANARNKATDILTQVQSGKLGYEKAATAFEIMASMSQDPEEARRYSNMAKEFSIADQKSKAAGRQVPVDLSAMGIQTQQIGPTVGTGASNTPALPPGVTIKR